MNYKIVDIVAFFDVGVDLIFIYKLSEETHNNIRYLVEIQQDFNSPSSYNIISDNQKIQSLFDMLKNNNCCLQYFDDMFIVKAIKFYQITLDHKDLEQSLQIVAAFNYNPVGSIFEHDISNIPTVDYKKIFNNFERLGHGGFPIF